MRRETLEQLEGCVWPPPNYDSHLVLTVHQLRKKPLAEFTNEDLRIMIGQGVGLPHLMPRAVEVLEREPLAQGDFYPGDLLSSVLRAASWLESQPALAQRVAAAILPLRAKPGRSNLELRGQIAKFLERFPV